MSLKNYFRKHYLFYLFLVFYTIYLFFSINPGYLGSDEAPHAMTSVFFKQLIINCAANPFNLYSNAAAYHDRYPGLLLHQGVLTYLVNALLPSILLMKLVTLVFAVLTVIMTYHVTLLLFKRERDKQELALLSAVLTATSSSFIRSSVTVMPELPGLFLFMTGLYCYYKKRSWLSSLFFSFSVLVNTALLPYVIVLSLIVLKNLKQERLKYVLGLIIPLTPYFILIIISGGSLIGFQDHPIDWLYYWRVIVNNYSLAALPFLFVGLYYAYKHYKGVLFYVLMSFLVITLVSDKAGQRVLNIVMFLSPLMALALQRVYASLKSNRERFFGVFTVVLIVVLQMPLLNDEPSILMSVVAQDLKINCPNCTVLVAGEAGVAYSSYLMYESLIRDPEAGMRFIKVLEPSNALELINKEGVNRVVVIGKAAGELLFVTNHYDLEGFYDGDVRVYEVH